MLIDTHAHIYSEEYGHETDDIIVCALESGVRHIFMPNIDATSIDAMHAISAKYPQCHSMLGLHPCYVKEDFLAQLAIIEQSISEHKPKGIGEVGIDLFWDKTFVEEQIHAFELQIRWALDLNLPVIIHSRDSLDLTIEIIEKYQNGNLRGIFHCFNGTLEQGKRIENIGFLMGLGGVITYKNSGSDRVIPSLSMDHFVLETDAPYLSPVPHRGKRNQPAYIHHVANQCARLLGISVEEVIEKTGKNAAKLFGIEVF
jgi:TatD DNase family protein